MDDGGFVYPASSSWSPQGDFEYSEGITRRDWLAGLAMQAIFGGVGAQQVADRDERYDETNWAEVVAKNSYEMADAMIAEGGKNEKS